MSMRFKSKVGSVCLPGSVQGVFVVSSLEAILVKKVFMCVAARSAGMADPSSSSRLMLLLLALFLGSISCIVFQKILLFFCVFF